jgi:hypothetical protein
MNATATPVITMDGDNGNVGIGTSSPSYKLSVVGDAFAGIGVNDGTNTAVLQWHSSDGFRLNVATSKPMLFFTNDTERMRITSGGMVGIGSTGYSNFRLQITGATSDSTAFALGIANSNVQDLFYVRNDGYISTGNRASSPYNLTSGIAANMVVGADGTLYRSTSSSQRFKENIIDWDGSGLDTILSLKPKTFTYKEDYYSCPDRQFIGLIAEEVAEVSSFLADFENEDGTGQVENVRYAIIVVPLIAAIQEQNQLISELRKELDSLKQLVK